MPMLSLAFLLFAMPPQDMLASAVGPRAMRVQRADHDGRDDRIAELEAEVARLKRELAARQSEAIGEWRPFDKNPAYEIFGREIGGQFHYIASRKKRQ